MNTRRRCIELNVPVTNQGFVLPSPFFKPIQTYQTYPPREPEVSAKKFSGAARSRLLPNELLAILRLIWTRRFQHLSLVMV